MIKLVGENTGLTFKPYLDLGNIDVPINLTYSLDLSSLLINVEA